jgi:hypothetical protein
MKAYKELKEDEVECSKCEGQGICNNIPDDNTLIGAARPPILGTCSKCNGSGKTDWVSNAMQKPNNFMFIDSNAFAYSSYIQVSSAKDIKIGDQPLDEYIAKIAAKKIAEAFDKAILEGLLNASKGGKIFDNGIVSKLMLHSDIKQEESC